jgi:hypothetical protein
LIAVSLTQKGLQRIDAGFTTLREALIDAGRGLYAILSGIGLLIAGIAVTPWMWISRLFTRRVTIKVGEARDWKSFLNTCRRVGQAVLEWVASALVWGLVIVGLTFALHNLDVPFREALTNPANVIYPIAFFLALGVLYLVGRLALRLGAVLIARISRGLTREGVQALAVLAVVIVVGAAGAILYASLKPTHLIALIAGVAVVAGLAGLALVSFGPSGVAIFNVGRWGRAPAGPSGRQLPARSVRRRPMQSVRVAQQPAISAPSQGAASLALGAGSLVASTRDIQQEERGRKEIGKRWSMPPLSIDRTGVLLVLGVVLAILLAWGGGELLLRVAPGRLEPAVDPLAPAGSPTAPRDESATSAAMVIQLGADGEPADVSWRSGYRQLTARFDDGRAVQQLSLPATACRAAAIAVFGAASSDGSAARNEMLAERRARWLADWTRTELSSCPDPVPVVIAVALGQAKPGLPLPAQRAVRLLAIRAEDMRDPAFSSSSTMLRDMARASFKDLDAFTRFDACIVTAHKGDQLNQGWPGPCEIPRQ